MMTTLIVPMAARAQGKTDFSGAWTLDAAKSDAPMAGRGGRGGPAGPVTLAIKQTAAELTIETKRGDQSQTATFKLDGSESKNETMGRGGPQTVVLAGINVPMVGCVFVARTGNVAVDDVPPPAPATPPSGFVIERLIVPGVAIAEAGTFAVT